MPKARPSTSASSVADLPDLSAALVGLQGVSYEQAAQELETLVQNMERGNLSVEDSLQAYQRGAALARHCQQILDRVDAQVQVQVLDGELLKPLHSAQAGEGVDDEGVTR